MDLDFEENNEVVPDPEVTKPSKPVKKRQKASKSSKKAAATVEVLSSDSEPDFQDLENSDPDFQPEIRIPEDQPSTSTGITTRARRSKTSKKS